MIEHEPVRPMRSSVSVTSAGLGVTTNTAETWVFCHLRVMWLHEVAVSDRHQTGIHYYVAIVCKVYDSVHVNSTVQYSTVQYSTVQYF